MRASFGVRGANIPAVLRALVACGWFGIQTWIGGQAIYSMMKIIWPAAAKSPSGAWICGFTSNPFRNLGNASEKALLAVEFYRGPPGDLDRRRVEAGKLGPPHHRDLGRDRRASPMRTSVPISSPLA